MKVGILTLHSQLNYGGVLQVFALQMALTRLGHEVVVIDRWQDKTNQSLKGIFSEKSLGAWLGFFLRVLAGCGVAGRAWRHLKTMAFLRRYLSLTPYHFTEWNDAPADLGVDVIVVGSDQVWHGGDWGNPLPYLLEGAPPLTAIAYAASFGMPQMPESLVDAYRAGMRRFSAISVRETEGVALVSELGRQATHVVDPTLLLSREDWCQLLEMHETCIVKKPCLVCYFLSEDVEAAFPALETFARESRARVEVFVDDWFLPVPKSSRAVLRRLAELVRYRFSSVRLRLSAGPREFVEAFARATWVVSDSFHALMFSAIFAKNGRVLRPKCEMRKKMFARIEEFAQDCVQSGTLFSEDLPKALRSLTDESSVSFDDEALALRRGASEEWLSRTLLGFSPQK